MYLHRLPHRATAIGTEERQMPLRRISISWKSSHEPYVVIASGDGIYKDGLCESARVPYC